MIQSAGLKESDVQYDYNATAVSFCFTVTANGVSANISSGNSTAKEGGCAGHGVNGIAPITNLFTNPSAELNTTGWATALTGVTITPDTTEKHSGARSMRVVTPGTAVAEGAVVTVTPGGMPSNRYSGGIWVKAPAGRSCI